MRTVLAASLLILAGCPTNYLDLGHDLPAAGSGGGGATSTPCEPGAVSPCYAGPAGTEGVGLCKAGSKTCNATGTAWGACTGEVHPELENCATPTDEDCNGLAPWCTGDLVWSKLFGNVENQAGLSVAVGSDGDVLITGYVAGAADFGGGPIESAGVFVAKLDGSGKHLWSKTFGDAGAHPVGNGIAVDGAGNVVVTGYFDGALDFGGGTLQATGGTDVFVAKLDASGKHLWSRRFGDAGAQGGNGIAVDNAGNVVVSGFFSGAIDFGSGSLQSAGQSVFLAKFDAHGKHQWSKTFGDALGQELARLAVDTSGNVLVTGSFLGTVDCGGGPLPSAGGSSDVFLAKFDATGQHLWSKAFGDSSEQVPEDVTVDSAGNVLVTGYFHGAVDFGGGPLQSAGLSDVFLAKLDASGGHLWSRRFGDAGGQAATGLAVDSAGNVLLTGSFSGAVDLGGGPLQSAGQSDVFVAKLDATGKHLWSKAFGDAGNQAGWGVAADGTGNALLTGSFSGAADFGDGPLPSAGGLDIFLAKFAP